MEKLTKEEKIRIKAMKMALKLFERTSVTFTEIIKQAEHFESYIKNNNLS